MKALILSGGTGTRLRPFTYSGAKQLLPIANKPILFHIIEKVVRAGIKDIGIIVGDTCDEIEAAVGNGSRWDAAVTYIHQQEPLGLAHAVKVAGVFLKDDDFLMILGDNLLEMELDAFIDFFYSSRSNACILLHKVPNPSSFGIAVIDGTNVKRLVEKPKEYIGDLAIIGVYMFDSTIFPAIEEIKPSFREELEITDAIQRLIDRGGKVSYQPTAGWWKDTGSPQDMLEANRLALSDMASKTSLAYENGITVSDSMIIEPVVIGENARIIKSVIGPFVSVGSSVTIEKCTIEDSIVMEGTKLENINHSIKESLIGRNVIIKGLPDASGSPASFIIGDRSEIII